MILKRNANLQPNKIYRNKNGSNYICLSTIKNDGSFMRDIISGWTFYAHNITLYENGTIEWDYSSGGEFTSYWQ